MPAKTLGLEGGGFEESHINWRRERVSASPERRWIVKSHIGWGGERSTLYKGVKTSPLHTHFKNFEEKFESESPKRTISANDGLNQLR